MSKIIQENEAAKCIKLSNNEVHHFKLAYRNRVVMPRRLRKVRYLHAWQKFKNDTTFLYTNLTIKDKELKGRIILCVKNLHVLEYTETEPSSRVESSNTNS
jgi:hypothetical protein